MKKNSTLMLVTFLGATMVIFATGCSTCRNVHKTQNLVQVDAVPGAANTGYVEFSSTSKNFPVPVFYVDNRGHTILLGSVGLQQGDRYCYERNGEVGEHLRVAVPDGNHTFMIERQGKLIQVPVQNGQLTPVSLNYQVADMAAQYVAYRLDTQIMNPRAVPATPAQPRD